MSMPLPEHGTADPLAPGRSAKAMGESQELNMPDFKVEIRQSIAELNLAAGTRGRNRRGTFPRSRGAI